MNSLIFIEFTFIPRCFMYMYCFFRSSSKSDPIFSRAYSNIKVVLMTVSVLELIDQNFEEM